MTDPFTDQLSSYLDDDLTPAERLAVERHLLDCAACRTTLDGLRDVVSGARVIEDEPPARDLWPNVRAALTNDPMTRWPDGHMARWPNGPMISIPQALAASVLLAVVSSLCVWVFMDRERPAAAVAGAGAAAPASLVPVDLADQRYDRAIDDLTKILNERRATLNPRTVEALERSLAKVDRAIAEAREALARDPSDAFLKSHLAQQRRLKVALLRQAAD